MDPSTGFPVLVCVVIGAMLLMSLWARRQNLIRNLVALLLSSFVGLGVFMLLSTSPAHDEAPMWGVIAAAAVFFFLPARKRRMKAIARRKVAAKWMLKTGKKFNPRFHEIDHVVPFSRGGNETEDNLRVIEKGKNRRKGARGPWWDILNR